MQLPNSLIDKGKAIMSDGLCSMATFISGMLQPFLLLDLANSKKPRA